MDVNNAGLAVGCAGVSGVNHAAAFFMGRVFDLGVLEEETYANGVNDHGEIVGSGRLADGSWRGFLLSRGERVVIGTIGGVPGNVDVAKINNRGTVCGSAAAPNAFHGFLYRDGEVTELADLGSSANFGVSVCSDVSENDIAVGSADDAYGWSHAVLWNPDGPVDLMTRIPPEKAATLWLFWASGINPAGQITVYGFNFLSSEVEGYLLSPVRCDGG